MDIQLKEMNQLVPIHVSVLILVSHHERSMNLKLVVFSFTIVIQVLCMWFRRRRREDDTCSTFALSFVDFWFGLGNRQLLFDATRSLQHFLCLKLLRRPADHLESESLKKQFLQEVMLRMELQKSL